MGSPTTFLNTPLEEGRGGGREGRRERGGKEREGRMRREGK
jgi:hypothetical protein